jgi:DNA-binding PadR family transcriptional regulator
MSPTRLLILGAVRIFQPVHGYLVRRELMSWHADEWAHLNPGSIYNALRTMARDGILEEVGTETEGGRPARTTYRLTAKGEAEFLSLLREGLLNIAPYEPANLLAAWSFAWVLPREQVLAVLEQRLGQITAADEHFGTAIDDIGHDPDTPDHVVEHLRLTGARLDGEGAWIRDIVGRLRAGEYWFAGEPNPPWSSPEPPPANPPSYTRLPQPSRS